jgi:acyl-CoA dehydrogenase
LWLGLATGATQRARTTVRSQARKTPGVIPMSATRLAELDLVLFSMRSAVHQTIAKYQAILNQPDVENAEGEGFSFAISINNLKLVASQLVIEIVSKALMICGISGYRNDSKLSLGRYLRDAYGAALMVNNDRILGQSAIMQIVQR